MRVGIYCAPLRLLAHEIFIKLNRENVKCNLLTGQEVKEIPFATHVSCTVELASVNTIYEVAVIDEIQMMGDPQRGFAWTRALLGVIAPEVHICGDASAISIVKKICESLGEEVEIVNYNRLNNLELLPYSLKGDFSLIQDYDCIVMFSRMHIFDMKRLIESRTNKKCCVIYGSLPPGKMINYM